MKKVAVITPVYNRAYIIEVLFRSLTRQTNCNFTWYVVNDGSSDNIREVIGTFIKDNKIEIRFFEKSNGGKHTALNYVIPEIDEDYAIIVDSDDYLVDNAVDVIIQKMSSLDSTKISGISFLRMHPDGKVIGNKYTNDGTIGNFISDKMNKNDLLDKAEVFFTSWLKKFKFPEFPNEKFLFEDCVWIKMGLESDMLLCNTPIYICDYLEDGLTVNARKQKFSSPNGMIYRAILWMNNKISLKNNVRGLVLYQIYKYYCLEHNIKQITFLKQGDDVRCLCYVLYPFTSVFARYLLRKWEKEL